MGALDWSEEKKREETVDEAETKQRSSIDSIYTRLSLRLALVLLDMSHRVFGEAARGERAVSEGRGKEGGERRTRVSRRKAMWEDLALAG